MDSQVSQASPTRKPGIAATLSLYHCL